MSISNIAIAARSAKNAIRATNNSIRSPLVSINIHTTTKRGAELAKQFTDFNLTFKIIAKELKISTN